MKQFIYKNSGSASKLPVTPTISRFVSPWDTSGWYSVLPDFDKGVEIYSNSNDKIASCDEKYIGAEYIMTFNSAVHGFDDRQEVDFFVERDAVVSVCLDKNEALPEWIDDYTVTNDEMVTSNGAVYTVVEKTFSRGEHVHVPGLKGDGNHFFVLARPASSESDRPEIKSISKVSSQKAKYKKREYKWYINEVFNESSSLDGYDTVGDVSFEKDENDDRRGHIKLSGSASVSKKAAVGKKVVFSAVATPVSDSGSYVLCAMLDEKGESVAGLFVDNGSISAVSNRASKKITKIEYGKEYSFKLIYDEENSEMSVWINNRRAADGIKACGKVTEFGNFITNGELLIDNMKLYDDKDVFVCDENGKTLSARSFKKSENAAVKRVAIPFRSRPSIALGSRDFEPAFASYEIPAISGKGTVETKVRASSNGLMKISLLTKDGEAATVAFYKNNIYAVSNGEWKRIFAGLTDFMYYPADNFYEVRITFNTSLSTYSLWIDGAKRANDLALANVGDICGIGFETDGEAEILIGKILAYDDEDLCRGVIPCGKVYNVKEAPYNAKGDGTTLDTEAIQRALDDAAYTGGTVLIENGTFLSGELMLRSDETVFVAPSATILGSQDHANYHLKEPKTSLCAHRQLGRGLLYGEEIRNITITGGGTLDGNGRYRYKMNDPLGPKRNEDARPDIVYITYSDHINIENINFKSSAFWTVVPLSSGNVHFKNLYLDCMNTPNRDGIDPVDCHDITVENCCIMAGDDGLCFKSSDPVGCYNIDVRNMMIQSLASGIKFGTDTYYCLMNARICDCTVKNVNRCGVSLETVDGAEVSDVVFDRIDMTDVGAPVYVTVGARNRLPRGIDTVRKSFISGVLFRDIRFEDAYPFSYTKNIREVIVCGQSDDQRIDDIIFENCHFELCGGFDTCPGEPKPIDAKYPEYDRHGLSAGHAFTVRYANGFKTKRCRIILDSPDCRPMTAMFDCDKK